MTMTTRTPGSRQTADINVTPMVDVMLVLLIIFMIITPMLQPGITVNMARATNAIQMPDATTEGALIVAVMGDGKVYLGTHLIQNPTDLTQGVKDWTQSRVNKEVFVKADARARYKDVVKVVDNVRAAGVDQLGLLTEQRKGTGPGS